MVTIIRGMKVNSGKRKLKSINVVDHKYVNKKSNPYVNIKNKPKINIEKLKPEPIREYTANIINTDNVDENISCTFIINGVPTYKAQDDYEQFKFNTLAIEITCSELNTLIMAININNGTNIKMVTSGTGDYISGEVNEIMALYITTVTKINDTIVVTFEDDNVLKIPITFKFK